MVGIVLPSGGLQGDGGVSGKLSKLSVSVVSLSDEWDDGSMIVCGSGTSLIRGMSSFSSCSEEEDTEKGGGGDDRVISFSRFCLKGEGEEDKGERGGGEEDGVLGANLEYMTDKMRGKKLSESVTVPRYVHRDQNRGNVLTLSINHIHR